jgi:hypothetical protein
MHGSQPVEADPVTRRQRPDDHAAYGDEQMEPTLLKLLSLCYEFTNLSLVK